MKKLIFAIVLIAVFGACGSDPKLSQEEEKTVENQVAKDQAAMDSLEKAILAQMDSLNLDSGEQEVK